MAMYSTPDGWHRCNGAELSRTVYALLFSRIGTTYGEGDGSTTFNLPDFRGEFIRCWDDGRGVDPGRERMSIQESQNIWHEHKGWIEGAGAHSHGASTVIHAAGSHNHTFNYINTPTTQSIPGVGAAMHQGEIGWKADNRIDWAGEHAHGAETSIAVDGHHTHAIAIEGTGGTETRPRNVALCYCIKY